MGPKLAPVEASQGEHVRVGRDDKDFVIHGGRGRANGNADILGPKLLASPRIERNDRAEAGGDVKASGIDCQPAAMAVSSFP